MKGTAELADELIAQASQDEADAFNEQHALARDAGRAVQAIIDAGAVRKARCLAGDGANERGEREDEGPRRWVT